MIVPIRKIIDGVRWLLYNKEYKQPEEIKAQYTLDDVLKLFLIVIIVGIATALILIFSHKLFGFI